MQPREYRSAPPNIIGLRLHKDWPEQGMVAGDTLFVDLLKAPKDGSLVLLEHDGAPKFEVYPIAAGQQVKGTVIQWTHPLVSAERRNHC